MAVPYSRRTSCPIGGAPAGVTVAVVSTDNVFEGAEIAAGYATARPPVHPLIIDKVSEHLRLTDRLEQALDVGCGAGQSTRALLPLARRCTGLDPVEGMIQQATTVGSTARFVIARAEQLPVRSRSIELLTAGGSLDYADLDRFLPKPNGF
jgi:SAM-dependent methyltransferase